MDFLDFSLAFPEFVGWFCWETVSRKFDAKSSGIYKLSSIFWIHGNFSFGKTSWKVIWKMKNWFSLDFLNFNHLCQFWYFWYFFSGDFLLEQMSKRYSVIHLVVDFVILVFLVRLFCYFWNFPKSHKSCAAQDEIFGELSWTWKTVDWLINFICGNDENRKIESSSPTSKLLSSVSLLITFGTETKWRNSNLIC